MRKSKLVKYGIFCLLYSLVLLEIVLLSGLLDPRLLLWPCTKGNFVGVGLTSRFCGSFYYRYEVDGKERQAYQLLSAPYDQSLKPGQVVSVHYNKVDPQQSVFEPGFNSLVILEMVFVLLLGLLLFGMALMGWFSRSKTQTDKI